MPQTPDISEEERIMQRNDIADYLRTKIKLEPPLSDVEVDRILTLLEFEEAFSAQGYI